jgi:hypothetical protein
MIWLQEYYGAEFANQSLQKLTACKYIRRDVRARTGSLQRSGFLPEYHADTRRVSCQYYLSIKCRHQSESDHCKSGLFVDVSYEQSSCTNSVSQIHLQTLKDGYEYN